MVSSFCWQVEFKVNKVARSKPGPTGIGGILHNLTGQSSLPFCKSVGLGGNSEREVLATLKAMRICLKDFQDLLIVEISSSNTIMGSQ